MNVRTICLVASAWASVGPSCGSSGYSTAGTLYPQLRTVGVGSARARGSRSDEPNNCWCGHECGRPDRYANRWAVGRRDRRCNFPSRYCARKPILGLRPNLCGGFKPCESGGAVARAEPGRLHVRPSSLCELSDRCAEQFRPDLASIDEGMQQPGARGCWPALYFGSPARSMPLPNQSGRMVERPVHSPGACRFRDDLLELVCGLPRSDCERSDGCAGSARREPAVVAGRGPFRPSIRAAVVRLAVASWSNHCGAVVMRPSLRGSHLRGHSGGPRQVAPLARSIHKIEASGLGGIRCM